MSGPIKHIHVEDVSLAPAEAELLVTVTLDREWGDAEVRGRLMGPRCCYSRTVEIAYPLRPLAGLAADPRARSFRVIIPEASWWDLQSPFLYEGPVELWQSGQRLDQSWISHGLRSLTLGRGGVRLNGRPVDVCGREVENTAEGGPPVEDLVRWRSEGINLLVAPIGAETEELWTLADQRGFLVLGRSPDSGPATRERLTRLQEHASCLGWLSSTDAQQFSAAIAGRGDVLLIRDEQTGLIRLGAG